MKMKKSLLSVAFLLATSSAMAAMSFSSAEVKSDMNVSVKNTNEALLALIANGDHSAPGYNGHGELVVNLDKGYKGNYGVQNDSKYTWNKLFTVKNNSDKEIEVTVQAKKGTGTMNVSEDVAVAGETDASAQFWTGFPGKPPGKDDSSETLAIKNANDSNKLTFKLAPGATKDINVSVETKDVKQGFKDFDLNVNAKRTDGK